jgi:hypothetical protein
MDIVCDNDNGEGGNWKWFLCFLIDFEGWNKIVWFFYGFLKVKISSKKGF